MLHESDPRTWKRDGNTSLQHTLDLERWQSVRSWEEALAYTNIYMRGELMATTPSHFGLLTDADGVSADKVRDLLDWGLIPIQFEASRTLRPDADRKRGFFQYQVRGHLTLLVPESHAKMPSHRLNRFYRALLDDEEVFVILQNSRGGIERSGDTPDQLVLERYRTAASMSRLKIADWTDCGKVEAVDLDARCDWKDGTSLSDRFSVLQIYATSWPEFPSEPIDLVEYIEMRAQESAMSRVFTETMEDVMTRVYLETYTETTTTKATR